MCKTSCWLHDKSFVMAWPGQVWPRQERPGQNRTFVLKATGGSSHPDVSPCWYINIKIIALPQPSASTHLVKLLAKRHLILWREIWIWHQIDNSISIVCVMPSPSYLVPPLFDHNNLHNITQRCIFYLHSISFQSSAHDITLLTQPVVTTPSSLCNPYTGVWIGIERAPNNRPTIGTPTYQTLWNACHTGWFSMICTPKEKY